MKLSHWTVFTQSIITASKKPWNINCGVRTVAKTRKNILPKLIIKLSFELKPFRKLLKDELLGNWSRYPGFNDNVFSKRASGEAKRTLLGKGCRHRKANAVKQSSSNQYTVTDSTRTMNIRIQIEVTTHSLHLLFLLLLLKQEPNRESKTTKEVARKLACLFPFLQKRWKECFIFSILASGLRQKINNNVPVGLSIRNTYNLWVNGAVVFNHEHVLGNPT